MVGAALLGLSFSPEGAQSCVAIGHGATLAEMSLTLVGSFPRKIAASPRTPPGGLFHDDALQVAVGRGPLQGR